MSLDVVAANAVLALGGVVLLGFWRHGEAWRIDEVLWLLAESPPLEDWVRK